VPVVPEAVVPEAASEAVVPEAVVPRSSTGPRDPRQPMGDPARGISIPDVDAELQASRARLTREAAREREADKLRLVGEILPVLDDLDRSVAAARRAGAVAPALLEGFELVRARLERVLEGYGLERIVAAGAPFDPAVHEAIALVPVDDPERVGVVVDEIERGYRAGDRVLRAARVRVGGR
jgi:molecular chaperone GrpE